MSHVNLKYSKNYYNKKQAKRDLKTHFGVNKVIFIEGIPDGDLTKGHIDGVARFIGLSTVAVIQCTIHSKQQQSQKVHKQAMRQLKKKKF